MDDLTNKGTIRKRAQKVYSKPPGKTGPQKNIKKVIKEASKKHNGPPRVYDAKYHIPMAYLYCSEQGVDYNQLAKLFLISPDCLRNWMRDDQKLFRSIRMGLDLYLSNGCETTLAKKATGYTFPEREYQNVTLYEIEETTDTITGKTTVKKTPVGQELRLVKETWKHVQPDFNSLQMILTNRCPERWSNVQQLQIKGQINHVMLEGGGSGLAPIDPTKLTDAELVRLIELTGGTAPPRIVEDAPQIENADYTEIKK